MLGTEAFAQDVSLPLWAVLLLAAYTPERLANMARRAKGVTPSSTNTTTSTPKTDGGE